MWMKVRVASPVDQPSDRAILERERLAHQLAVDAAGVGVFDWDLRTGSLRWDARLLELFGLDEDSFGGTIEAFNACLHPEDVPRVTHALQTAIETRGEYAAEYRIIWPDGQLRWIGARGRALADTLGGPATRVLGAAYDTTAVQDGEARVARVLETMPTAFFQLDRTWRFSYANSEAERLLALSRNELVGGVIWDLFPESVGSEFEENYRGAVASGEPSSFDAYYPPLSSWYEVRCWPSPDGLSVYFSDITRRHEVQEELDAAARRSQLLASAADALTGTLDATEGVSRLATILVPLLADWCVVTLVEEHSSGDWRRGLHDIGWAHADSAIAPLVERYAALRLAAMTDESFLAQALVSAEPALMVDDATEAIARVLTPGPARDLLRELDPASALVVPLRGHDRTVGVLSAYRGTDRPAFSEDDLQLVVEVAARAGLALDNARLYSEQRDLAEALQRSLLTAPPQPDGIEIAVRYVPAAEVAQVGGDWYDAFLQPDGSTVVVIGDVVGHDVAAAAAMGQVRGLLRGIAAYSGDTPADIVRGVDAAMETLQVETTATAVVCRIESRAAVDGLMLTWSSAGHPAPALVAGDQVRLLEPLGDSDLLLGLEPGTDRSERDVVLPPGGVLLLYTDGLVEKRSASVDRGLARMQYHLRELAGADLSLDELCDALLDRMLPERPEDDVALVAVRVARSSRPHGATPLTASSSITLDGTDRSAGAARRLLEEVAGRVDLPAPVVEIARLLVSEVATNAVRHGAGRPLLRVEVTPARLRVEVSDGARGTLTVPDQVELAEGGRGLLLVDTLASRWGVEEGDEGKTVWFELDR